MLKKSLFIFCILCFPTWGYAFTASQNGNNIDVHLTEPTTNKTGTPLVDLGKVSIYSNTIKTTEATASALTGGGIRTISFPHGVGVDQETNFSVYATASDTTGNESLPSTTVSVRVDKLAPAPPQ